MHGLNETLLVSFDSKAGCGRSDRVLCRFVFNPPPSSLDWALFGCGVVIAVSRITRIYRIYSYCCDRYVFICRM